MNYVKKQVQRSSRNRMILCGSLGIFFLTMLAAILYSAEEGIVFEIGPLSVVGIWLAPLVIVLFKR